MAAHPDETARVTRDFRSEQRRDPALPELRQRYFNTRRHEPGTTPN